MLLLLSSPPERLKLITIIFKLLILINWICATPVIIKHSPSLTHTQLSSIRKVLDLKTRINKVTLHKATSSLYVASTNHLYKINDHENQNENGNGDDESFRVIVDVATGPRAQKQQCAFITESMSEATETQCIKYICDDDAASKLNVDASIKVSLLLLKKNKFSPS